MYLERKEWEDPNKIRQQLIGMRVGAVRVFDKTGTEMTGNVWQSQMQQRMLNQRKIIRDLMSDKEEYEDMWRMTGQSPTEEEKDYLMSQELFKRVSNPTFGERLQRSWGALFKGGPEAALEVLNPDRRIFSSPIRDREANRELARRYNLEDKDEWNDYLEKIQGQGFLGLPSKEDWNRAKLPEARDTDYYHDISRARIAEEALRINRIPHFIMRSMGYDPLTKEEEERLKQVRRKPNMLGTILDLTGGWIGSRDAGRRHMENMAKLKENPELATMAQRINMRSWKQVEFSKLSMIMMEQYNGKYQRDLMAEAEKLQKEIAELDMIIPEGAGTVKEIFGGRFDPFRQLAYFWAEQGPMLFDIIGSGIEAGLDETKGIQLKNRWWNQTLEDVGDVALTALLPVKGRKGSVTSLARGLGASAKAVKGTVRTAIGAGIGYGAGNLGTGSAYGEALLENVKIPIFADEENEYRMTSSGAQLVKYPGANIYTEFVSQPGHINGRRIVGFTVHGMPEDIARKIAITRGVTEGIVEFVGAVGIPGLKGSGLLPSKIMNRISIQAAKDWGKESLLRKVVAPSAMRMTREAGLQVAEEVLQELGGHYLENNIRRTANVLRGTNFEIDTEEWKGVLGETLNKSILGALTFVMPTASINFGMELKSFNQGRARFEHVPGGKEFYALLDKDSLAGTFDEVIENNAERLRDRVETTIGDLPEDIRVKIEKGELSKTDLNEHNLTKKQEEELLQLSRDHEDQIVAGQFRENVFEQSTAKLNAEQEAFKENLEVSKKIADDQKTLAQTQRKWARAGKEANTLHVLGDNIENYKRRELFLREEVKRNAEKMEAAEGKEKIPYSDVIQKKNTEIKDNLDRKKEAIQKIRGRKKGDVDIAQDYTTSDPELGTLKVIMTLTEGENVHWRVEKYNKEGTKLELTEDYGSFQELKRSLTTNIPVNTKLKIVSPSLGARTGSIDWRKKGAEFTGQPVKVAQKTIFTAENLPPRLKSLQDRMLRRLRDAVLGNVKDDVITTKGLMGFVTSGEKVSLGEWLVDNIDRVLPEGQRKLGVTDIGRKRVVDPEIETLFRQLEGAVIRKDLAPEEKAKKFKANRPLFKFLVSKVGTREDVIQKINKSIRDYMKGMVDEVNALGTNTMTRLENVRSEIADKKLVDNILEAIKLHRKRVDEATNPKAVNDALRKQAIKNILEKKSQVKSAKKSLTKKDITKAMITYEVNYLRKERVKKDRAILLAAVDGDHIKTSIPAHSRGVRTISRLGTTQKNKVLDFNTMSLRQLDRTMKSLAYSASQVVQANTLTVSQELQGLAKVAQQVVKEIARFIKRSNESVREGRVRRVWNTVKRSGLIAIGELSVLNVIAHKDSTFRRVVMLGEAVSNTRRIQERFSKKLQRSIQKHVGRLPANTEFASYLSEQVESLKLMDENGRVHTREMDRDKLIALYLHFQNPSNTRHITPQPLKDGEGSVGSVSIKERRSTSIPGLIFRDKYVGFNSDNALSFFVTSNGKARHVLNENDLRRVDIEIREYLSNNMKEIDFKYAEAVKEFYEFHWQELNAFYRELNGIDLSRVENYFPLSVGKKYSAKVETVGKDEPKRTDIQRIELNVPEHMTEERQFSSGAIHLDGLLRVINKSIYDGGSYIGLSVAVKDARNLLDYKEQVQGRAIKTVESELKRFDDKIPLMLEKHINDVIGFHKEASELDLVDKTFAWFRRNATKSFLSLNWAVSVAQSLSYAAAATYLDTGYLWKAVAMDFDSETSKAFDQTFKELSGLYIERVEGNVDRDVAYDKMSPRSAVSTVTGKPVTSLVDKGLFAVRFFDRITVRKVMMAGVLQAMDQMESGNITEDFITNTGMNRQALVEIMDEGNKMEQLPIAIRFAETVVERSQPMFNPAHRSHLSNTKNELVKMFTPFRGWQDAVLNMVVRESISLSRGDKGAVKRLGTALFSTIIVGSLGMWVLHSLRTHLRNLLRDEDKEFDSIWDKLFDSVTGPIPFVGGVMQNLHHQIQRIKKDGRIQPIKIFGQSLAAQPFNEFGDLITHVWKYFEADSDRWREYHALQSVKQMLMTMILVTGLPYSTKQAIDLMIRAMED